MAYYWQLRRIVRQKLRSLTPNKPLSYQQWSRRRLLISFVLFFIGWKAIGVTLNDMLLWETDELTGKSRMLSPAEGKERRAAQVAALTASERAALPPSKYALDD